MAGYGFENEVRSVARARWHLPPGEGAAERIGGDEIDCVCRTEDVIHLIECTVERTQKKVVEQANKLNRAKRILEKGGNAVKLWMVTRDEPTPDQRTTAREDNITILSIEQFRRALMEAREYLELRWKYRFGSATDPATGNPILPEDEYIELPIREVRSGDSWTVERLADFLQSKNIAVLQGPFGAGKSLTVREVFKELRRRFYNEKGSGFVPLALNLRDHWGQTDVDEALRRHAARIGFAKGDQLVRAWNAGQAILLLDGFDELAAPTWQSGPESLRRSRVEALRLVRLFVQNSQGLAGLLLAGRDNYFDSEREATQSLALPFDTKYLKLEEFVEKQLVRYLERKGITEPLPAWLPRKPLLLGYLASRNLFPDVIAIPGNRSIAYAWDSFVGRICDREAQLNPSAGIDAQSVRHVLEVLATATRTSRDGTGPLHESDINSAYKRITGYDPLEGARVLLQRLPGLTPRNQEGGRYFADEELLQTLRAGDVARFIEDPYTKTDAARWQHSLNDLGYSVAAQLVIQKGLKGANYRVAVKEALDRWNEPTLALDCLLIGTRSEVSGAGDAGGARIREAMADTIDFSEYPITNVTLDTCLINVVRFDAAIPVSGVELVNCMVHRVEGVADSNGFPVWVKDTAVGEFDDTTTNAAIIRLPLPVGQRTLLTVLRKLYLQPGAVRLESALTRGLPLDAVKYVEPVLQLLKAEGIVYSHPSMQGAVWHANRIHRSRVSSILSAPALSNDTLVIHAAGITPQ